MEERGGSQNRVARAKELFNTMAKFFRIKNRRKRKYKNQNRKTQSYMTHWHAVYDSFHKRGWLNDIGILLRV